MILANKTKLNTYHRIQNHFSLAHTFLGFKITTKPLHRKVNYNKTNPFAQSVMGRGLFRTVSLNGPRPEPVEGVEGCRPILPEVFHKKDVKYNKTKPFNYCGRQMSPSASLHKMLLPHYPLNYFGVVQGLATRFVGCVTLNTNLTRTAGSQSPTMWGIKAPQNRNRHLSTP